MTRSTLTRLATASALLLGAASGARASETDWSYHFTATPHISWASGPGTGAVLLPGSGGSSAMGGDADVSTKLWTTSTATQANPQTVDTPFSVVLHLRDGESGLAGAVTFTGSLQGTIWDKGSDLHVTFHPDDAPTKQTLHLHPDLFEVTFVKLVTPTGNGPGHFGELVFHVRTHHNPEPSSLVLALLGVPVAGVAYRRRRRAARA